MGGLRECGLLHSSLTEEDIDRSSSDLRLPLMNESKG